MRRNAGSGESMLTSRGEEIARQYLFAERLVVREPLAEAEGRMKEH